jgi:CRISPR-associated protein Csm4
MMADLRLRIRLAGPLATPPYSPTLFGHFCWTLRLRRGEESFSQWLGGLEQNPLILSDAMPSGYVPVPLLAPPPRTEAGAKSPGPDQAQTEKKLARRAWLRRDDFLALRGELDSARLRARLAASPDADDDLIEQRIAHNQINRLTGTTPAAGGLYFVDEFWPDPRSEHAWDIYVRSDLASAELLDIFETMGRHGFGRDATLGRGRFDVVDLVEQPDLAQHRGNRWVSWSRGCAGGGTGAPRYRLYTHYGKLGGLWAAGPSPFKYPVTLWKPGATFAGEQNAGPFGRLLRGVHPSRPEVIHNAWHFAIPYTEVEPQ